MSLEVIVCFLVFSYSAHAAWQYALGDVPYNTTKSLAKDNGWETTDRRIFQIEYSDGDKYHKAEVGEFSDINNETVMAILESNACYLICTPNSGVFRNIPILIGRHEIRFIEDFGGRKEPV